MSLVKELTSRSGGNCEMCASNNASNVYVVAPKTGQYAEECVHICTTCQTAIDAPQEHINHWRCLNDAIWNENDSVKVVAFRLLHTLKSEGWPNDLLDMMYLEDEAQAWANAGLVDEDAPKHRDSNGVILENGDSVVLIKDLDVKGATFTAKRGTAVRNIRLVHDNVEQIEGKINGQSIVILTQYVKK